MAMPDDLTALICLFHSDDQAQAALKDLHDAGIPQANITVLGGKTPQTQGGASVAGLGVPKRDQQHLEEGLRDGGVLVAVSAVGDNQKIVDEIFKSHKASKIDDQRLDDYTNYKKFKPETQEHSVEFANRTAPASAVPPAAGVSSPARPSAPLPNPVPLSTESPTAVALVEDGVLTDEYGTPVGSARVVHIYRRNPLDPAL